jgi:hypothetical protein
LNIANIESKIVKVCINESSLWKRDLYYCDNDTEEEESAFQKKLHATCLKRDQYRCPFSGYYSPTGSEHCSDARPEALEWDNLGPTCAAHIIPFRLGKLKNNAQVCSFSTSRCLVLMILLFINPSNSI